jgi:hypothetical protein
MANPNASYDNAYTLRTLTAKNCFSWKPSSCSQGQHSVTKARASSHLSSTSQGTRTSRAALTWQTRNGRKVPEIGHRCYSTSLGYKKWICWRRNNCGSNCQNMSLISDLPLANDLFNWCITIYLTWQIVGLGDAVEWGHRWNRVKICWIVDLVVFSTF